MKNSKIAIIAMLVVLALGFLAYKFLTKQEPEPPYVAPTYSMPEKTVPQVHDVPVGPHVKG